MPYRHSDPYSPPEEIDVVTVPPHKGCRCPWCQHTLSFKHVYWSLSPRIQCPQCGQSSLRRKHGYGAGVTEAVLLATLFAIPFLVAKLTHNTAAAVILFAIALPIVVIADIAIDRRLAYLAKPN